jgi:glycosyltransferase involved in cell wall biosynthesis
MDSKNDNAMSLPFVSIILCTYNGERFLQKQLDSLVGQTYPSFEVIAVDDCSTDGSHQLLVNQRKKDDRFQVFRNDRNLGLNWNFEFGIRKAKGEYLLICDQDDIWEPVKLEHLVSNIDGSLLYYHDSRMIGPNDEPLNKKISDKFCHGAKLHPLSFIALNCVTGHTCMFPKELISKPIFPFPKHIFYDNWLGFIASTHGNIRYVDECLVRYRIHGQNNAVNKKKEKRLNAVTRAICMDEINSFYQFTPQDASYRNFLGRLRDTYGKDTFWNNLYRALLFLSHAGALTAARKKNRLHRLSLCLKMAYKVLPNHLA